MVLTIEQVLGTPSKSVLGSSLALAIDNTLNVKIRRKSTKYGRHHADFASDMVRIDVKILSRSGEEQKQTLLQFCKNSSMLIVEQNTAPILQCTQLP